MSAYFGWKCTWAQFWTPILYSWLQMLSLALNSHSLFQVQNFSNCNISIPVLWHIHTHTHFVPRLSPHPEENENGGRAWYRFVHDIGAQRLCTNLKCHLHEDCEIAVKYSQFTTTLFCCVAMLELWNVAVVLFYMLECSAKSFLEPFLFVKLEHGNSK